VIGKDPDDGGADQDTEAERSPALAATSVGAPGGYVTGGVGGTGGVGVTDGSNHPVNNEVPGVESELEVLGPVGNVAVPEKLPVTETVPSAATAPAQA
jgi:hypothetical protein